MFKILHYAKADTSTKFSLATIVLAVLLSFVSIVNGASDDFIVRTVVGSENTPPTTPSGLVATPIAISQINLSWGGSTDDFILSGYHIWRDEIQIATTTATTYADTGLSANILYTYYVTAYDSFLNESASSTLVATTTLSLPTPTTSSLSARQGSLMRPLADEIISLEVLPQRDSVIIRYETKNYIRSIIKWGKSTSYELGSLAENAFITHHETKITGLTPGTRYQFIIDGENKIGRDGQMHQGTFVTLPPEDIFPPENVTNLSAIREGNEIVLSWTNPEDPDFAKVRVVRSDLFYPGDIVDGWVVYEGDDTSIQDTKNIDFDKTLYYTVFSYDTLGNISSGAVVSVYLGDDITVPKVYVPDPSHNEISLHFDDIAFSQEGEFVVSENGQVFIDGTKQLTIAIPYERLPEHLKTILVTVRDSQNSTRTFNFLLRVNKGKTEYTSTVAPFGTSGNFPITVSVFDFKTAQIGYTDGTLVSRIQIHSESETSGVAGFMKGIERSYIVLLVIFVIGLMYFGRRILRTEF